MKGAIGYSVWLIPSADAYSRLLGLITQLSKDYGGPLFDPHVTLIGGVLGSNEEIVSKTLRLASLLEPFTIELENLGYSDEFFRCVFIRVKRSEEVMGAYSRAQDVFRLPRDPQWMPHLSILYGDFSSGMKAKIIQRIGSEFALSFVVTTVRLMLTEGRPEDWRRVRTFSLKERPPSGIRSNSPDRPSAEAQNSKFGCPH
jgi:2'-5' RNA ligase